MPDPLLLLEFGVIMVLYYCSRGLPEGSVVFFNLVSRILAAGLFSASRIGKLTAYGTDLDLMEKNYVPALLQPRVLLLAMVAVLPLCSVS